jgi:hypothetical protein
MKKLKDEIEKSKCDYNSVVRTNKKLVQQHDEFMTSNADLFKSNDMLVETEKELDILKADIEETQETLRQVRVNEKTVQRELVVTKTEVRELKTTMENAVFEAQHLVQEKQQLSEQLEKLSDVFEVNVQSLQVSTVHGQELEKRIQELEKELQTTIADFENKLLEANLAVDTIKHDMKFMQQKEKTHIETATHLESALTVAHEEIQQLQQITKEQEQELLDSAEEIEQFEEEVISMQQFIREKGKVLFVGFHLSLSFGYLSCSVGGVFIPTNIAGDMEIIDDCRQEEDELLLAESEESKIGVNESTNQDDNGVEADKPTGKSQSSEKLVAGSFKPVATGAAAQIRKRREDRKLKRVVSSRGGSTQDSKTLSAETALEGEPTSSYGNEVGIADDGAAVRQPTASKPRNPTKLKPNNNRKISTASHPKHVKIVHENHVSEVVKPVDSEEMLDAAQHDRYGDVPNEKSFWKQAERFRRKSIPHLFMFRTPIRDTKTKTAKGISAISATQHTSDTAVEQSVANSIDQDVEAGESNVVAKVHEIHDVSRTDELRKMFDRTSSIENGKLQRVMSIKMAAIIEPPKVVEPVSVCSC